MSMAPSVVRTARSASHRPKELLYPAIPGRELSWVALQGETVMCSLPGLRFGDYELVDPILIDVSNNNAPSDADPDPADEPHDWSLAAPATTGPAKRAFLLNDELEAEAARRRLEMPVRIPERRFGHHLSEEVSLRFRYATSWVDYDTEQPDRPPRPQAAAGRFATLLAASVCGVLLLYSVL